MQSVNGKRIKIRLLSRRRIATALLFGVILVFACTGQRRDSGSGLRILCSFYPLYISTINVTGDAPGVSVENMARVEAGCLHDYQLTPADMKKIAAATVFIVNGGGLESFLDKATRRKGLKIIDAGNGIEMIPNEHPHSHHHHHHDGEERDEHHDVNPHVWVSVSGAIAQVKNIRDGLAAADPDNAETYRSNADAYIARLMQLQERMRAGLEQISTRDIVTFHEAFPYFARDLDLRIAAVIQREPGSEPSAAELAHTIRIVRKAGVKALFAEPQYPAKAAQTVARETGSRVFTLDPAVSGPLDPDAYIRIMESNLAVLREALR